MSAWTPLPGRVAVRMLDRVSTIIVDPYADSDTRRRAQTSHRGVVVAMGPPARTPKLNAEVPPGFSVGAEVVFVFGAPNASGAGGLVESAREGEWDGAKITWVAQEEVLAVVTT